MGFDITEIIASANAIARAASVLAGPLSLLLGLWQLGSGLRELVKDPHRHGEVELQTVARRLLVGGLLVQFALSVSWTRGMLGGAGGEVRSAVLLASGGAGNNSLIHQIFSASLFWVAVIGVFGMLRGFWIWGEAGSGESSAGGRDYFWSGLWHILGGALAINIGTA